MTLNTRFQKLQKWLKCLSFLVLLTTLCYPALACAHPQAESFAATGVSQDEAGAKITIELAEVAELDKVARFTQLLAKSPHLSELQLTQVQLKTGRPESSFVRWTARLVSATTDDLEQTLQSAAGGLEGFEIIHRQSYRDFVVFALNTLDRNGDDDGGLLPMARRSTWPVHSGQGFD